MQNLLNHVTKRRREIFILASHSVTRQFRSNKAIHRLRPAYPEEEILYLTIFKIARSAFRLVGVIAGSAIVVEVANLAGGDARVVFTSDGTRVGRSSGGGCRTTPGGNQDVVQGYVALVAGRCAHSAFKFQLQSELNSKFTETSRR